MKVHEPQPRDKYKNIVMNKTQTVRELLRQIRNDDNENFLDGSLKEIDDKNIRLRGYDSRLKVMQKIFEDKDVEGGKNAYDMTLIEHNFHSYYELKIEVREEGA